MNFKKNVSFRATIIFLVFIILFLAAQSAENIQISGFVNDYANVISSEYKSQIEGVLESLYDGKIAEFSIVTIKSLEGQDIESYALNLAQGKLGDKEKNNGLLLLVSVQDKKYRFEVGRGLEATLNDAKVGRIGRTYLQENFRNREYGKGIYEASIAVQDILQGKDNANVSLEKLPVSIWVIISITILIFVMVIAIKIWAAKRLVKSIEHKNYFDAAMMAAILFGGKGKGGIGGGGFSGGGFGGFGGGGFGGGGASGGW